MRSPIILIAATVLVVAAPAWAHHEAIYGSQSALVLSGERYVTVQVFSRQTGPKDERVQETTTVLSGGLSSPRWPVSLSIVVPFSVIAEGTRGGTRIGLENAVVAARYRLDAPAIARRLHVQEGYLLAVGGVELPTGTIDYDFGQGAPATVAGGQFGLERRPFSVIAYGLVHRYAERRDVRDSGNTFIGGGLAWTPIDTAEGHVLSLQFGVSREVVSRETVQGAAMNDTGGWAVVAHPTVTWSTNERLLFFASTSVPMAHQWRNPAQEERFRIGLGAILALGR
jgi:hypothetical protein